MLCLKLKSSVKLQAFCSFQVSHFLSSLNLFLSLCAHVYMNLVRMKFAWQTFSQHISVGCVLIWEVQHVKFYDGNVEESANERDVLLLLAPNIVSFIYIWFVGHVCF